MAVKAIPIKAKVTAEAAWLQRHGQTREQATSICLTLYGEHVSYEEVERIVAGVYKAPLG